MAGHHRVTCVCPAQLPGTVLCLPVSPANAHGDAVALAGHTLERGLGELHFRVPLDHTDSPCVGIPTASLWARWPTVLPPAGHSAPREQPQMSNCPLLKHRTGDMDARAYSKVYFLLYAQKQRSGLAPPQKGVLWKGREAVAVMVHMGLPSPHLPSCLFRSPLHKRRCEHSLPPTGGLVSWGGTTGVEKIMPMFHGDGSSACLGAAGGVGRLLRGGRAEAGTPLSQQHLSPPPSRTGPRSPHPSSPLAEAGQSPRTRYHRLWRSWYQIQ